MLLCPSSLKEKHKLAQKTLNQLVLLASIFKELLRNPSNYEKTIAWNVSRPSFPFLSLGSGRDGRATVPGEFFIISIDSSAV
jgi:hypothetical protein